VQPFNAATVQQGPLILIGTFTGVNAERKTEGKREAFRICLALADLKTGKLVSKGLAFAKPTASTPARCRSSATRRCGWTTPPPRLHPHLPGHARRRPDQPGLCRPHPHRATIAEAIDAYAEGKYADALKLYETALASPGGNQLRVHTGLYLTNLKLRRMDAARKAFGEVIDQGLDAKRLGVKFLFRPGTAALWTDPKAGPPALPDVAGEIAARTCSQAPDLPGTGRPHQRHRRRAGERTPVAAARRIGAQVAGSGVAGAQAAPGLQGLRVHAHAGGQRSR
jgi:hypothetical protein